MSNRRGSISDYPEHLNPFYEGNEKFRFWKFGKLKRSGSFGETLRNTLTLKSFRGRKKEKQQEVPLQSTSPELRRHDFTHMHHRQTLPTTTLSPIASPERNTIALPRSRFSERVGKPTDSKESIPNGHTQSSTNAVSCTNPFEEDEKLGELKPKRIRRRKKRAPLPPNMSKEDGDAYLGVSSLHNLSKWSLTSVETDVSTYSESDHDRLMLDDSVNQEMSEIMNNITKEMEKLTDDVQEHQPTGGSIHDTVTEEKPRTDIPDIIASSTEMIKDKEKDDISKDSIITEGSEQKTDENSNLLSKEVIENNEENCTNSTCDDKEETSMNTKLEEKDVNEQDQDSEVLYNTTFNHAASAEELNFNERKSIYITASNDNLNDVDTSESKNIENVDINSNEQASPPTSPRLKTVINVTLNNNIEETSKEEPEEKEEILESENEEKDVQKPIPKVRTHTPTKNDLLGSKALEN